MSFPIETKQKQKQFLNTLPPPHTHTTQPPSPYPRQNDHSKNLQCIKVHLITSTSEHVKRRRLLRWTNAVESEASVMDDLKPQCMQRLSNGFARREWTTSAVTVALREGGREGGREWFLLAVWKRRGRWECKYKHYLRLAFSPRRFVVWYPWFVLGFSTSHSSISVKRS